MRLIQGLPNLLIICSIIALADSCKKLVSIPPPVNTITTSDVFNTSQNATSVVNGIYSTLVNNYSLSFGNGAMSVYCGLSSDELLFSQGFGNIVGQFNINKLESNNNLVMNSFWQPAYFAIYEANAAIAGLPTSGIDDSVRNELMGESKFIRAFCYFYLTNLFGEVPLMTTTNYAQNALLSKASQAAINSQIIQDLVDAESLMAPDYSVGGGQRIVPNKWAAAALLAREYLYTDSFANATAEATKVINQASLYSLCSNLSDVFLTNSSETIWQMQQNYQVNGYFDYRGI